MGGGAVQVNLGPVMFKRLRVNGTVLRSRPIEEKIALTNQIKRHVLPLIASGAIKPVVDSVYPLSRTPQARTATWRAIPTSAKSSCRWTEVKRTGGPDGSYERPFRLL